MKKANDPIERILWAALGRYINTWLDLRVGRNEEIPFINDSIELIEQSRTVILNKEHVKKAALLLKKLNGDGQ